MVPTDPKGVCITIYMKNAIEKVALLLLMSAFDYLSITFCKLYVIFCKLEIQISFHFSLYLRLLQLFICSCFRGMAHQLLLLGNLVID